MNLLYYYQAMYIETVPNRKSRPCILLRESYREKGKVVKKTVANISDWNKQKIEALRLVLKGETRIGGSSFEIIRSLPHGAVTAVLGTMKRLDIPSIIAAKSCRKRNLVLSLIASRILSPGSKLETSRDLNPQTAINTLSQELSLNDVLDHELYTAMDYLLKRKFDIETRLAKKHLSGSSLILYDLTSVYFEGTTCPLTRLGHSRDGKKGTLQIIVGLLTNKDGVPISTEVFEGNILDQQTLSAQINKVRERFALKNIIFVGDRGTITAKRIEENMRSVSGLSFITALRSTEIKGLITEGSLQLSLFDTTDLAEIQSPMYPGERLICCRNPFLAAEREQKREELLQATEKNLKKITAATAREKRALRGKAVIGIRVGKIINKYKMAKHFLYTIDEKTFSYQRNDVSIQQESLLDGIYVIRTTVGRDMADASKTVEIYKGLSKVERAFRCLKTVDLNIRPVYHRLADRVRSHVFLCMLAYYVEWHMKNLLSPILFEDEEKEEAQKIRSSVVAKAVRSNSAKRKDAAKITTDGFPVHSFQSLLSDLSTLTRNTIQPKQNNSLIFEQVAKPTSLQKKALDLLQVASFL